MKSHAQHAADVPEPSPFNYRDKARSEWLPVRLRDSFPLTDIGLFVLLILTAGLIGYLRG